LKSLTENNPAIGEALPSFTIFEGETLFLKGDNSNYITQNEAPIIAAHFPNSKIIGIQNAGHWLHAENPKQFYAAVCVFLKFS
jgi:esterase